MMEEPKESELKEAPYVSPSKGTLGQRAKKYIASKTAGTTLGRKIINSFLGTDGEKIVAALTAAAVKFHGKKEGIDARTGLYKIATKVRLAVDQKQLKKEDTLHADMPLNQFGIQLLDALSKPAGSTNVKMLQGNISRIQSIVCEIMKAHLQEKNYNKLKHLFEIYGAGGFLSAVLDNEDYQSEKKELYGHLSKVLKRQMLQLERQRNARKPKQCAAYQCSNGAAPQIGNFIGSKYCAYHHMLRYANKLKEPVLEEFISDSEASPYFAQYLSAFEATIVDEQKETLNGTKPLTLFNFLRAVNAYEELSSGLRLQRAEIVARKYLKASSSNFVGVDKAVCDKVRADMEAPPKSTRSPNVHPRRARRSSLGSYLPSRELFEPVCSLVRSRLKAVFSPGFLKSRQYETFSKTIRLPPELVKLAEKQAAAAEAAAVAEKKTGS
mmetsp:Transcript_7807/g.15058  ORF Transcript_7807/g.15058 Transcript_7807/m.15058 type:complete len:439 (-) Transcript_7807:268-1584(-)